MGVIGREVRREFYSIGEVCDLLDLKPHVVRYWETQFPALEPTKNRAGNRVYRAADIELIARIRELVHEERYTVEGAQQQLDRAAGSPEGAERAREALKRIQIGTVVSELREVAELLEPPG